MAYSDLGKLVKQKYPGSYDDYSDDQLGQVVSQKYPGTYDDIIGQTQQQAAPTQPQQPQHNKPGYIKLFETLGLPQNRGVSQVLAQPFIKKQADESNAMANHLNEAIVNKIKMARQQGNTEQASKLAEILRGRIGGRLDVENLVTSGEGYASGKEAIGDLVKTATLVGPSAAGLAGKGPAALRFAPQIAEGMNFGQKAAAVGKTVLPLAIQGAKFGGTYGAADALSQDKGVGDVTKQAITGAATGAVTQPLIAAAFSGVEKLLNNWAGKKWDAVYGVNRKDIKAQLNSGKLTPGQEQVNSGKLIAPNTQKGYLRSTTKTIKDLASKYDDVLGTLDDSGVKISGERAAQYLDDEIAKLSFVDPSDPAIAALESQKQNLLSRGDMSVSTAHKLKSGLWDKLSDPDFLKMAAGDPISGSRKNAYKLAAIGIKDQMDDLVANAGKGTSKAATELVALNKDYGAAQAMRSALVENIAKNESRNILQLTKQALNLSRPGAFFTDIAYGGLGALLGAGAGATGPGGLAGGLALYGANRLATSTPGLTTRALANQITAKGANALSPTLSRLGAAIAGGKNK